MYIYSFIYLLFSTLSQQFNCLTVSMDGAGLGSIPSSSWSVHEENDEP